MTSVSDDLRREQRERTEKMTPAERLALAEKLSEEGLAAFMAANGMDRRSALNAIRRSRRVGRRPSVSHDEER